MTNEGLKKKIIEILEETEYKWTISIHAPARGATAVLSKKINDFQISRSFFFCGWWQWKAETLEKENELLKAENAALRERLDKAVEFPCRVGDKVYCIHRMSNPEMLEWQVNEIRITDHNYMLQLGRAGTKDYRNEASQFYGKWWFVTREAAEARLAELKGEKE